MGIKGYEEVLGTKQTPQSEPIPGEKQVLNHAGGYVFQTTPWQALDRFLILGTSGGTYYVSQKKQTQEAAVAVRECLSQDGPRVVARIAEISESGRAPSNDPAIVALAMAASVADIKTREAAYDALPRVCRIPTHLFSFLRLTESMRGWSRGLRNAVKRWYTVPTTDKLGYHAVKYIQREGFGHRDALRLSHADTSDPVRSALFRFLARDDKAPWFAEQTVDQKGKNPRSYPAHNAELLPDVVKGYLEVQDPSLDVSVVCKLITDHNLTREMLPSERLTDKRVWEALLERMPIEATIRNLGNISKIGLLTTGSEASKLVQKRLLDQEILKKGRVHPIKLLVALKTYAQGKGVKGSSEWTPVPRVIDALNDAFYLAFGAVTPVNKPLILALDVSGSMSSLVSGLPISCREAAAALALVQLNADPDSLVLGFTSGSMSRSLFGNTGNGISELKISAKQRLDDVVAYLAGLSFGGTDCSLPAIYATKNKLAVDGIAIWTDNETWAGHIHPSQALKKYREQSGRATRLVVGAMTANEFTIADPKDPLQLDVVGFDTATPDVISEFMRA